MYGGEKKHDFLYIDSKEFGENIPQKYGNPACRLPAKYSGIQRLMSILLH